jgi:N6-L-threonylcarbamoyladenine synthase
MNILGIETSFDETAAAVVKNGKKILGSALSSSQKLQQKYGGIIPEKAAREQIKCIIPVIQEALNQAKLNLKNIDVIACTIGPGLIGSLLIGVETAKTLSFALQKKFIPVNHLKAHLYANFLENEKEIKFPSLGLIASGGHTEIFLIKSHKSWHWLGGTQDDAAGECLDKCGRILGFSYPGGPAIEKSAQKMNKKPDFMLPRPLLNSKSLNFSFSGLKTAFVKMADKKGKLNKNALAWELQEAVTDVLTKKTLKAAELFKVKSILLGGGVTANQRLRQNFKNLIKKRRIKAKLFIPKKNLCTDNAIIIAAAAFYQKKPKSWKKIKADPSLEV